MNETELLDELNEDLLKPLKQENAEVVPYAEADSGDKQNIDHILQDLDINDTQSIISFGSSAQEKLTTISDKMLEGVQNKDVGPAGDSLNEMVADVSAIDQYALCN